MRVGGELLEAVRGDVLQFAACSSCFQFLNLIISSLFPWQLRKRAKQQSNLDANCPDSLKLKVQLTQAESQAETQWRERLLKLIEKCAL